MRLLLSEHFTLGPTPAWRTLLAVGVAAPSFLLLLVAHGFAMQHAEISKGLNLGAMWLMQAAMSLALLVVLAVAISLWPLRNLPGERPRATLFICLAIGLGFTAVSIGVGTFTSGMGLIQLGVLAVGLLLFDVRPLLVSYLGCALSLLTHELGVQAGWWTYAPALRPQAFVDGAPAWWFGVWRQVIFFGGFTVLAGLLMLAFANLDRVLRQLSRLSYTDSLTGLANRRRFMEVLKTEVARQARTGQPLCLVLIDADHFKQVNDVHGHLAGDAVLRTLGRLMMVISRSPIDLACRLGGEEFAMILPDTTQEQALGICKRLREQLAAQQFGVGPKRYRVTVSMGVVVGQGHTVEALLRLADEQLYRAKSGGRDRICGAEPGQGGAR